MASRTPRFSLVVLSVLALSACSAGVGVDGTSSVTGGAIELAVSDTCGGETDSRCLAVNGQNIILPSTFERAGVENAAVAQGDGQNAVDVTFTESGAAVLQALTEKAAHSGDTARLVMKIDGEIRAAVAVMQALEGDYLLIHLSPEDNAQEVVDALHGG